jgi:hypothetical protein
MMAIDAVKGRDPWAAGEVCVYKNLLNGRWSITAVKGSDNRGELLGYADEVSLVGARMVVKESRRQAIASGKHREVCAWIIGKLGDPAGIAFQRVTFRPHQRPLFFLAETGEDITTADAVRFDRNAQAWI